MNVKDALLSRRSCRGFKPDAVEKETVRAILETATHAPSWANTQPWEIYVAAGDALERLRRTYMDTFKKEVPRHPDIAPPKTWPAGLKQRIDELMKQRQDSISSAGANPALIRRMSESNARFFDAPVVIYLCMDRALAPWSLFDLGSLAQSIMLAAEERGLGTIPAVMLAAYPELIRAELAIPDQLAIVIGIALGHLDPENPMNKFRAERRPIDAVATFKGF